MGLHILDCISIYTLSSCTVFSARRLHAARQPICSPHGVREISVVKVADVIQKHTTTQAQMRQNRKPIHPDHGGYIKPHLGKAKIYRLWNEGHLVLQSRSGENLRDHFT